MRATGRTANLERKTKETEIRVDLALDGAGRVEVATGLGFLDHMLTALAFHAGWDLSLSCRGDLEVDDHHTVEDRALGDRSAITRFGWAIVPMDEALARAAVDLSGRPCAVVDLGLRRESIGQVATENLAHFLRSLATAARSALHVDVLRGDNDHHRAEAAFKATARALGQAVAAAGRQGVPSTKGVL